MNLKEIFKLTTNQNLSELKKNVEWTNDIIERFGMFISERYDSLEQFFNENSEPRSGKFKFSDFLKFHESHYDLFNQGDLDTARELLEELLAIDDTHVEATALMGFVYRRGGVFPKAVEYARKASKLDKNNSLVRELIKELS